MHMQTCRWQLSRIDIADNVYYRACTTRLGLSIWKDNIVSKAILFDHTVNMRSLTKNVLLYVTDWTRTHVAPSAIMHGVVKCAYCRPQNIRQNA